MATLLPPGYLHTVGSSIVAPDGTAVRLAGVNWYGFDCNSMVVGGLDHQSLEFIVQKIADLGFNTIRLPFSDQLLMSNPPIQQYLDANPSLQGKRALDIMDLLITTAGTHGLKVILDCHRSEAGWSTQENGLWYTQMYPESTWLHTWVMLAQWYKDYPTAGNPTVIGCDLRNELANQRQGQDAQTGPWIGGSLWGSGDSGLPSPRDWAAAAQRAGNAILDVNPNLLIFIEGVQSDPAGPLVNNNAYWPGGNLTGVTTAGPNRPAPAPITLSAPDRLVYSAHDYGPNVVAVPWCRPGSTANDRSACYSVWDQTWGNIVKTAIAPVWLGEFGTPNGFRHWLPPAPPTIPTDTPQNQWTDWPNDQHNVQGAWFTYLVDYLADLHDTYGSGHWCYWAINGSQSEAQSPNGVRHASDPDWYGILNPDWSEVASQHILTKLQTIQ
jgi:aryl-phospho-beta-D-glucosidase BglC (GH1 family)